MIYELVFYEKPGRSRRRGLIAPSALRACRRLYQEALPFIYSMNRFMIAIEPDILKHRGAPHLAAHTTPLTNISYIRNIYFDLQVGQILVNGHQRGVDLIHWDFETQLQADIPDAQTLFHRACMRLINSGAVLETFELFSCMIWHAELAYHVDLLDCLKEVPVLKIPVIRGMMGPPSSEVAIYLEQLQEKMVSCSGQLRPGKMHAVTVEGMCKDAIDYTDACNHFIEASGMKRRKKIAACRNLNLAFLNPGATRVFPILAEFAAEVNNSTACEYEAESIRLYFERGLDHLETEFLKFPKDRLAWRDVCAARQKLYARKAFRDWGPKTAPNDLWCE